MFIKSLSLLNASSYIKIVVTDHSSILVDIKKQEKHDINQKHHYQNKNKVPKRLAFNHNDTHFPTA